jgi:hypothetical protein
MIIGDPHNSLMSGLRKVSNEENVNETTIYTVKIENFLKNKYLICAFLSE